MTTLPAASTPRRLEAITSDDGTRLDRFVDARCDDLSRSRCAGLIRDGWVTLNGATAKPSATVRAGDTVQVTVPAPVPIDMVPQYMPLEIVYQDDQLLVVDKPAGLTVHPAPGHPDRTLVNALLAIIPDLKGIGGALRPGIVHRLDKDTSGLMVVAKSDVAHASLSAQLKERRVRKTYLALVVGAPKRDEGNIDAPIGRSPRNRKKMAIVDGGREAQTGWKVVERYDGYTLVEAHPVTGRTHQIRVHLAAIGLPVVGDATYGKRSALVARHFLHAAKLGFYMPPDESEWREFESPLPPDLRDALAGLTEQSPSP